MLTRRRILTALALAATAVVVAAGCSSSGGAGASAGPKKPNIVFVLTDDLATNVHTFVHVRIIKIKV